jgi:mono/diheme cytochrome c family protein
MNRNSFFAIATLMAAATTRVVAAPTEAISAPRDIGREVLGVFAAKCAACHGPDLPKPTGRFGYILDLKRLAADTEKVIPPNPEESELWGLVERNEMPPADSPRGPLSSEQKDTIRKWIEAGAPDALSVEPKAPVDKPIPAPTDTQLESAAAAPVELATVKRFLLWLGKFHLLLLHFPIALVVAAGVAELLSFARIAQTTSSPSEAVRFCLWLSALAAIPTVAAGWLFASAGNGAGSPDILTAHRWLGTAAAVWLLIAAILAERDARYGIRSNIVRFFLLIAILTTAIAAHLGGLLARGVDFFNY